MDRGTYRSTETFNNSQLNESLSMDQPPSASSLLSLESRESGAANIYGRNPPENGGMMIAGHKNDTCASANVRAHVVQQSPNNTGRALFDIFVILLLF